jgi:hypothetical protein
MSKNRCIEGSSNRADIAEIAETKQMMVEGTKNK